MSVKVKAARRVIRVYYELCSAFDIYVTDIRLEENRAGGFTLRYWDSTSDPRRWVRVGSYPEPLTWKNAMERLRRCEDEMLYLPVDDDDLARSLEGVKVTGLSGWQADMIVLALASREPGGFASWVEFLLQLPEDEIQILAEKYGRIIDDRPLRVLCELASEAALAGTDKMSIRYMAKLVGVDNPWDFRKLRPALRRYARKVVGAAECIRYRHAEYVPANVLENLVEKPSPADVGRRAELLELCLRTRLDEYKDLFKVLQWILGGRVLAVFRLVAREHAEALTRFVHESLELLSRETEKFRKDPTFYLSGIRRMALPGFRRLATLQLELIRAAKAVGIAIPAELDVSEPLEAALAQTDPARRR
ncbi:MAG: hypothetical protein RMK57_13825 [Bryobacterales bacterium]|nr:hypothetical protein [Bryobacteraceae bacterium]MDW8355599.1 hypothetical protein [Bryobacterales bacterium]